MSVQVKALLLSFFDILGKTQDSIQHRLLCAAGPTELVGIVADAYTARCLHRQASDLLDTYR